ncbi:MAG: hypothetical protein NXI09_14790 [Bacteroidetes bacterium]|nr:hypothetical protein [Bacteroidota bacterium]
MNKLKYIVFIIIMSLFVVSVKAQDSLIIHVIGYFKDETFRFYYDSLIYTVKMENTSKTVDPITGFTFKIPLPANIREGDILNLMVKRKSKYGLFYRDTKLYINYRNLDYLVLVRDFRQRDRYPLDAFWTCVPSLININQKFWDKKNRDFEKAILSINEEGSIRLNQ